MTTTAVLFDLDDTLFDHRGCTRAALGALQARHELFRTWSFAEFDLAHCSLLERLHLEVLAGRLTVDEARVRRFRSLVEQAGGEATDAMVRAIAAEYRDVYTEHRKPVPGALALLQALHGRVKTGVVTNNVAAEQRQKIEECGFASLLDAVVISEEAGVSKPDPRIFEIALARLGQPAAGAVMVGDAWGTDIAGALAAGIRPVWFNRFGAASPDPSCIGDSRRSSRLTWLRRAFSMPESRIPNPRIPIPIPMKIYLACTVRGDRGTVLAARRIHDCLRAPRPRGPHGAPARGRRRSAGEPPDRPRRLSARPRVADRRRCHRCRSVGIELRGRLRSGVRAGTLGAVGPAGAGALRRGAAGQGVTDHQRPRAHICPRACLPLHRRDRGIPARELAAGRLADARRRGGLHFEIGLDRRVERLGHLCESRVGRVEAVHADEARARRRKVLV